MSPKRLLGGSTSRSRRLQQNKAPQREQRPSINSAATTLRRHCFRHGGIRRRTLDVHVLHGDCQGRRPCRARCRAQISRTRHRGSSATRGNGQSRNVAGIRRYNERSRSRQREHHRRDRSVDVYALRRPGHYRNCWRRWLDYDDCNRR